MSIYIKSILSKIKRKVSKILLLNKPPNYAPKWLLKTPKFLTSKLYASAYNCNWYMVHEHDPHLTPSPRTNFGSLEIDNLLGWDSAEFDKAHSEYREYCNEAGILKLNNALVYGSCGWIISPEGYLLLDSSLLRHSNIGAKQLIKLPKILPKGRRLEGTCLTIVTDGGSHYGHWLFDSLPKLELFRKAGFGYNDVDHIICPKPTAGTPQNLS